MHSGLVITVVLSSVLVGSLPAQDECGDAEVLSLGLTTGSNVGATTSPQTGSCLQIWSDVWYRFEARCNGRATVSFCAPGASAEFDSVLAAFSGSCGTLTELACNDDSCGSLSEISFGVKQGQIYYVEVGSATAQQGSFTLSFDCVPLESDECEGASVIDLGFTSGDNYGATTSQLTGSCRDMEADVWHQFRADCTGTVTASLCAPGASATFDTVIAAFSGSCSGLTELTCNDQLCGNLSEITFTVDAGRDYYIAVGGFEGAQGKYTLSLSCTPGIGSWRQKAPRVEPLVGAGGVYHGGKVYVSHGWNVVFSLDMRVYDPVADTWSYGPPPSHVRMDLVSVVVGDRYYTIGGRSHAGNIIDHEIFDFNTQTWSVGPSMLAPRSGMGGAAVGGRVHVVGGRDGTEPRTGNPLDVHEMFDPATGRWSTLAPLPIPVSDCTATIEMGGKLYVFGGWDGVLPTAHTQIYDPATDTWMAGTPMPTARDYAAAGAFEEGPQSGMPMVIGGWGPQFENLSDVEVYDIASDTWSTGPSLPVAHAGLSSPGVSTGCAIHFLGLDPNLTHMVHAAHLALPGSAVQRLGTPPNPAAFLPGRTPPTIGLRWDPVVDHSQFAVGSTLDFLVLSPQPPVNVVTTFGTLLCNPGSPSVLLTVPSGARFGVLLPNLCVMIGFQFCAQGGSFGTAVQLANALDVTIGAR